MAERQVISIDDLTAGTAGPQREVIPIDTLQAQAGEEELTDVNGIGQIVTDIASAFNDRLATVLGQTLSAGSMVAGNPYTTQMILDSAGSRFDPSDPDSGVEAVKSAFRDAGISTDMPDTLSGEIGREMFNNALLFALTMGTAPIIAPLAKVTGSSVGAAFKRGTGEMAKLLQKNPQTAAIAEVGASAGLPLGGRAGEDIGGPTGRAVGEVLGGAVGGGLGGTSVVRQGGRMVGGAIGFPVGAAAGTAAGSPIMGGTVGAMFGANVGRRVAERALTFGTKPANPLVEAMDPAVAKTFATDAIRGDQIKLDQDITNILNRVSTDTDTPEAAKRLWDDLRTSYASAQKKATEYWNMVDKSVPVNPSDVKATAQQIVKEAGPLRASSLPGEILAQIDSLGKGAKGVVMGPDGMPLVSNKNVKMDDLLAIHENIGTELRAGIDNRRYRQNLVQLDTAIMNTLAKEYPGSAELRRAREYSLWLHNHFSRGPVGDFIGLSTKNSTFRSDLGRDAMRMLRRETAGMQLQEVSADLDRPSLVARGQELVGTEFRRLAEEKGPLAGQKWLASPAVSRFMKNFPDEYARLEAAHTDLSAALETRKAVEKSALMSYSKLDPQAAVERAYSGGFKLEELESLVRRLADDSTGDAEKSLQMGMLETLFARSNFEPDRMEAILANPDMRSRFVTVLGFDKMKRLDKIIHSGVQLSAGKQGLALPRMQSFFARFVGAGVTRALGARTIQQTAAGAQASDLIYRSITGRAPAPVLMARAVIDPKMERYLLSQIPGNIRDMRREGDQVRALIVGLQGTGNLVREMVKEEE